MNKTNTLTLKTILFSAFLGFNHIPFVYAQQDMTIQSESMQQAREITVHLPKSYDPNLAGGYSVIYMLDAGTKDKMTAELANYYNWAEVMPKVIVVGLKNINRGVDFLPGYYDYESDGQRYSGNGSTLLAYIENELIPFVSKEFNTSGQRVFAGHSWGGQFVTYAMSQSPNLFDAYFITSPSFGANHRWGEKTFDAMEQTFKQDLDFPDFIYLSVGGNESSEELSDYHRLTAALQQHLPAGVNFYSEIHKSAVHNSNSAISLPKGSIYFIDVRCFIETLNGLRHSSLLLFKNPYS